MKLSRTLIFILFTALFAGNGWGYNIYLKNGQKFDVEEHTDDRGLFLMKLKGGYGVGIPKDDIDLEKSHESIDKYYKNIEREEADKKRKKELEAKEKMAPKEIGATFSFEKRGMQMAFAEDEAGQLIDIGEKNSDRLDDIIAPYRFFYDYMPSVIYTKRLRLILYWVEKAKSKKHVVTTEVQNIIQDANLLLLLVVTNDAPDFYKDADFYIEQDGKRVAPFNFKAQSKGERTNVWPATPAYFWKILFNFRYADLDLGRQGKLVLKKTGGYREYTLDFPSFR